MELRVPARLPALGVLREAVNGLASYYAGCQPVPTSSELYAWGLAVYEAATNVVRHGYDGGSEDRLSLRIQPQADQVVFSLRDRGRPNRAWPYDPQAVRDRDEGGYGMHIIHRVMDEVAYVHEPDGVNVLVMIARFPRALP